MVSSRSSVEAGWAGKELGRECIARLKSGRSEILQIFRGYRSRLEVDESAEGCRVGRTSQVFGVWPTHAPMSINDEEESQEELF